MQNRKPYDYLIVGSGLFGSVFAYEAKRRGKTCLVIDRRAHSGGNVYSENIAGINVHKYGAHIFHTNDKPIWDYVNQFAEFNNYINSPISISQGRIYNLPFNMNTFYQIWGVKTPAEARQRIEEQIQTYGVKQPANLEEQAISLIGKDVYELLVKEYTEKQWGKPATELPAFIIKRLPIRYTFDNNYFNDRYQGIPIGGYTEIINKLLAGTELRLGVDFFDDRTYWTGLAEKVLFTGQIDQYFDYRFGHLEYRSLEFETEILDTPNFQGNAVVNYNDRNIPFTRIIEHKHFEFLKSDHTVITREYPTSWAPGREAYYPVNDEKNQKIYAAYAALKQTDTAIFGGRLAEYKYYDMHQIIGSALTLCKKELL